jgi:hypothetical protein
MVLPYLKGLVIIKLWFSIWFHRSCVVIVFRYLWIYCDILYSAIWFLTSGIKALSRAGVVGNYFYFCRFFFSEKKKEGRDIPDIFSIFLCKICRKGLYI